MHRHWVERGSVVRAALVSTAAALMSAAGAAAARAGGPVEKPFPVDRTQILKGDVTYYVEGRVRIPKGVEIVVQKDTKIVGRGGLGVIEVEGELSIHGISQNEVPLDDVAIEVQPSFGEVNLSFAEFRAKSTGIRCPKDAQVGGRIVLEEVGFQAAATIDLVMKSGGVEIKACRFDAPVSVKGVDPPGAAGHAVKFIVERCCWTDRGFAAGLTLEGVTEVVLKTSRFRGESVRLVESGASVVDGDYFACKRLEYVESTAGAYAKKKLQRCDMQLEKIVLRAPPVEATPEAFKIDNCWFGGETSLRAIKQKFLDDHDVTAESGVVAQLSRPAPNALKLAGDVRR